MNSANVGTSKRLQRLLRALEDGREYSTLALSRLAHLMAVSASVAELRDNGYDIHCERRGQLWYYRLTTARA